MALRSRELHARNDDTWVLRLNVGPLQIDIHAFNALTAKNFTTAQNRRLLQTGSIASALL